MGKALISESVLTEIADKIRQGKQKDTYTDTSLYTPEEMADAIDQYYPVFRLIRYDSGAGADVKLLNGITISEAYTSSDDFGGTWFRDESHPALRLLKIAFEGEVNLPNAIYLPANFFNRTGKITQVNCPNVTNIGKYCFSGVGGYRGIYSNGSRFPDITVNAKPGTLSINAYAFGVERGTTYSPRHLYFPNNTTVVVSSRGFSNEDDYDPVPERVIRFGDGGVVTISLPGSSSTDPQVYQFAGKSSYAYNRIDNDVFLSSGISYADKNLGNYAFAYAAMKSLKIGNISTYRGGYGSFYYAQFDNPNVIWDQTGNTMSRSEFLICSYMFASSNIETLRIKGMSPYQIQPSSFYNSSLKALIIESDDGVPTLQNVNAFNGHHFSEGGIYVPDSLVDSYKSGTNWATYSSYIHPLSEYVEVSND